MRNLGLLVLTLLIGFYFYSRPVGRQTVDASLVSPVEVCEADRLLSFVGEPSQMDRNQIRYGCLNADWSWMFDKFTVINRP